MWRHVSVRTILHLALSVAVSFPIIVDVNTRFQPAVKHWIVLAALNFAIWASWPRYRSVVVRQVTTTTTLLIAANLLLSPLGLLDPPSITLPPNMHLRFRHVGDTRPGFEGVQEVITDAHGRRVNGQINYAHKPVGVLRIVAIGASTTEQADLDDRKTWTWLVAEDLSVELGRKVEMINTAVSGTRAPHYYAALRDSERYAPDVALFLIGINDWNAAIRTAYRPLSERILRAVLPFSFFESVIFNAVMIARGAFVEPADPKLASKAVQEDDGSFYSKQNNSLERPIKKGLHSSSVDDEYVSWVGKIMAECKRRAILCMFIEQPTSYANDIEPGLRRRLWMTPAGENYTLSLDDMRSTAATYNAFLSNAAQQAGFPFCFTQKKFPSRLAYFYDDVHFTTEGSRRLANTVEACLLEQRNKLLR